MIRDIHLTILLAVVIVMFYIMDFYFMFQYDPERRQEGKGWSWDYTLATALVGLAVLLQPIFLPGIAWSRNLPVGVMVQILGGTSIVSSFVLHIWARRHLRYFYTERVEVQLDHQVIDTGPYALVRHPIIVSFFLFAGGLFLINPAITTAIVLIYTIIDFSRAAKQEETLLRVTVPGYESYMRRTPRFFPRLRKVNNA